MPMTETRGVTARSVSRRLPAMLAGLVACLITALTPVACSDSRSGQSGKSGGSGAAAAEAEKEEKKELAPEFELQTLDGQTVR